jgi:hypothetical protein
MVTAPSIQREKCEIMPMFWSFLASKAAKFYEPGLGGIRERVRCTTSSSFEVVEPETKKMISLVWYNHHTPRPNRARGWRMWLMAKKLESADHDRRQRRILIS